MRTALVTGASGGIGAAVAMRLAAHGCFVVVHYRSDERQADEVLRRIRKSGGDGAIVSGDLSSYEGAARLLAEVDRVLAGRPLDILIDNAGVGGFASIAETTETMFDTICATNLKGTFFLTQGAMRRMSDGGRIVVISSGASRRASGQMSVYSMTKAALNTFMIYLAQELGPRQITCNALGIGPVETRASEKFFGDEARRREIVACTAMGRLATLDDMAAAICLFTTPESGWITGQFVEISGGYGL